MSPALEQAFALEGRLVNLRNAHIALESIRQAVLAPPSLEDVEAEQAAIVAEMQEVEIELRAARTRAGLS